jgi:hypothetical protein
MNLYLLRQNRNTGYDTFDACIVVAESHEEAKKIPPSYRPFGNSEYDDGTWARPDDIDSQLIGVAASYIQTGCVLASFNAG